MAADAPAPRLARHFYDALFDLGFLDFEGADSFRGLLIGVLAFLVSSGLLATREQMAIYARLSALPSPQPYTQTLLASDLVLLSLAMLVGALVAVLLGQSLFPDETDFRVLVPLPIPRSIIIVAKLQALLRFGAIFAAGTLVALTPVVLLGSYPRWASEVWIVRLAAFWIASLAAALFGMLAIAAINGAILVWVPARYRRAAATLARTGLLALLVLLLPMLARLPGIAAGGGDPGSPIAFVPPAWFLGLQRLLTGAADPLFARLAAIGAAGIAAAAMMIAACYASLYRRFDRVVLRAHDTMPVPEMRVMWPSRAPAASALRAFVSATLRRSPLHQGALIGVTAVGLALAVKLLANLDLPAVWRGTTTASPGRLDAVVLATLGCVFVATSAIRLALTLPLELRANWIFRVTETDASRPEALGATARAMAVYGVLVPVILLSPALVAAFGRASLAAGVIATLVGLLLVEARLFEWQRLPFTCSYLPGKRHLAATFLTGLVAFVVVTKLGGLAVRLATSGPIAALSTVVSLAVILLLLRRRRVRQWRVVPLAFEDVPPYRVESLNLFMALAIAVLSAA